MKSRLSQVAQHPAALGLTADTSKVFAPDAWSSAWKPLLAGPASNPMGVDWFAMVFGLGFVLSFGYWCTNFLVVQRAMAARNMSAARRTPLIAAVPKMIFPVLVILPGMIAAALAVTAKDGYRLPPKTLDSAMYAKAIPALKEAAEKNLPDGAAAQLVSEAAGVKMLPDKVGALVKGRADTQGQRTEGRASKMR